MALAATAYRPFTSTDTSVASKGALVFEIGPLGFLTKD